MSNDQALWIYDSGCSTDAIRTGVLAAQAHLQSVGVTAEQALSASLARANDESFSATHADAWDEAERLALLAADAGPSAALASA